MRDQRRFPSVRSLSTALGFALFAWLAISLDKTPVTWAPLSKIYGEESYDSHRFRWMGSPAEIVVWAQKAEDIAISGEWRCGFHITESVLEVAVNDRIVDRVTLSQDIRSISWTTISLNAGRNVVRFSSSAGSAIISAQDPREVATGVQDFQVHHRGFSLPRGHFLFISGAFAIALIFLRFPLVFGLQGDALGVGLLGTFGAISLTATLLSTIHALTGVTWVLALLAIAGGLSASKSRGAVTQDHHYFRGWQIALLCLPVLLVFGVQLLSPVVKYDDLMYHGSRAGYWLGNHSIFPFSSHNERQEVFPYAGDLLFAFGVFTARSEVAGRVLVFLAYPSVLFLSAFLLSKRGVAKDISIGAACLIGLAPQIRDGAIGIKPDLWGLVFTLVAINAAWDLILSVPQTNPDRMGRGIVLLGAVCAAVAIKATFLLLVPLAIVPFVIARSLKERTGLILATLGWIITFGLVVTLAYNKIHEGGWLSSPAMAAIHRPDPGVGAVGRHLTRLPFVVFGIPWIPNEGLRARLEEKFLALAQHTGAIVALPLERTAGWPGAFVPAIPEFNHGYSLLWLFSFAGAAAGLANAKNLLKKREGIVAIATIVLGLGLMIGVTSSVRWQANSGIPERFLTTGFAVTLLGAAWCWQQAIGRRAFIAGVFAILGLYHAVPFLHDSWQFFQQANNNGFAATSPDSVLSPAAATVPPGARVLLFASQSSGDYVLFHPTFGFPTKVFPWGRQPFSESAFTARLKADSPDVIVFEQANSVSFHWHEPLPLASFIRSLEQSHQFYRDPGGAPNLIYKRYGFTP